MSNITNKNIFKPITMFCILMLGMIEFAQAKTPEFLIKAAKAKADYSSEIVSRKGKISAAEHKALQEKYFKDADKQYAKDTIDAFSHAIDKMGDLVEKTFQNAWNKSVKMGSANIDGKPANGDKAGSRSTASSKVTTGSTRSSTTGADDVKSGGADSISFSSH